MERSGRARQARRLAVRGIIGALIVIAGLSGSIIGVAAGESLINNGQDRPPDVTSQEAPTTTAVKKADKPQARQEEAQSQEDNDDDTRRPCPGAVAGRCRAVSDPDSSSHRGWWVVTLIENKGSQSLAVPRHG